MTAATAHDLAADSLTKWTRIERNAKQIGNKRMEARAFRMAGQCRRTLAEWREHPALAAKVTPHGNGFRVKMQIGTLIRGSLFAAQEAAVEHGARCVDITACGHFSEHAFKS